MAWLPWLKALHVLCAVTFLSGLLFTAAVLWTLRHAPPPRWPQERRLPLAALRWNRCVTAPALVGVWLLGATLAQAGHWWQADWLDAKLVLVLALSAAHGLLSGWLRRCVHGTVPAGPLALRWWLPGLALGAAGVVVLVVAKPF